jgi:ABC-type sugar transport system permease subunit
MSLKETLFNPKSKAYITPYLFLLFPFMVYTMFLVYPMLHSLFISLFDWNGMSNERTFVGLRNFIDTIRNDSLFLIGLKNNVKWSVGFIILPVVLGLLLALLLNRQAPGFGVLRTAIFLPVVLSVTAVGLMWRWVYDPSVGLINNFLKWASDGRLSFNWYKNPNNVIVYLILAASWAYTGMAMVLFSAGIKSIPSSTIEASVLDGATSRQRLWYVILPQLRNTLNVVIIYTMTNSFKVFDLVYVMTGGGPGRMTNVLASVSYNTIFSYYEYGKGSAIAWLLTLILFAISIGVNKLITMQKN